MSFWTLIKHKVPNIHSKEDLLALPAPIIMNWWNRVWLEMKLQGVGLEINPTTPQQVWDTYMDSWMRPTTPEDIQHVTALLIRAMQEYEE